MRFYLEKLEKFTCQKLISDFLPIVLGFIFLEFDDGLNSDGKKCETTFKVYHTLIKMLFKNERKHKNLFCKTLSVVTNVLKKDR